MTETETFHCPRCAAPRDVTPQTARTYRERGSVTLCRACHEQTKPRCRECTRRPVLRGSDRGLCLKCERAQTRRIPVGNSSSPLPATPTAAPIGSAAKIREMAARMERGEALFHPHDYAEAVRELLPEQQW